MIVVVGPTASGKSAFAIRLAQEVGGEIVGADAVQVYRDLVIGAATIPTHERAGIPHHLIGVLDLSEEINAGIYLRMAIQVLRDIVSRGKVPIVVGGTNFYVDTLIRGLSPIPHIDKQKKEIFMAQCAGRTTSDLFTELNAVDPTWAASISSPNDRQRILRGLEVYHFTGIPLSVWQRQPRTSGWDGPYHKIGLAIPRPVLTERIAARTRRMLAEGLLDEVASIRARGFTPVNCRALASIGYREVFDYLEGRIASKEDLENSIITHTRHLAKRQMTWLKKDEMIEWRNVQ